MSMKKAPLCLHPGCKRTTTLIFCSNHKKERTGQPTPPSPVKPLRPKSILDRLVQGTVHTTTEGEPSPFKGTDVPNVPDVKDSPKKAPVTGSCPVSPGLFLLVGHRLDKTFDCTDFGLDEEEAVYMSRCLSDAATAHGVNIDPLYQFAGALALWVVPPLLKHLPTGAKKVATKERSAGWKDGLVGRRSKKRTEVPVFSVETTPATSEPAPGTNPEWKQTDLAAMEAESQRALKISS